MISFMLGLFLGAVIGFVTASLLIFCRYENHEVLSYGEKVAECAPQVEAVNDRGNSSKGDNAQNAA